MKPGRNDTCPCGSGRKYKRCCGQQPAAGSAVRHVPTVAGVYHDDMRQFAALADRGRWDEVERRATALLEARPDVGMLWKILGVSLVRQRKEALPALHCAARLLPDDAEAHCNLGVMLQGLGRRQDALASFRQVLLLSPHLQEALVRSADILSGIGQPGEAVALYRRALQDNPASSQVQNNLGNALFELGRHHAAIECYRAALHLRPGDAKIHCNLGNALREISRLEEAIESSRRAIALSPAFPEAHNNLGLVLAALGELAAAKAAYQHALALDANHVDVLNNLANTQRDLGEVSEAMVLYRRAIELDPLHAETRCNLGNLLFDLRRMEEAAESYAEALSLKPSYKQAHLALGMVQRLQGRSAAAEASCQAALACDPNYAEALALLGELRGDRGEFSAAQALFQRAAAADPGLPLVFFHIAMHRKMTSDDTEWLERAQAMLARRLPPKHEISLRYALGKYFDDVGKYEQAFDNYRQANELTQHIGPKYDAAALERHVEQIVANGNAVSLPREEGAENTSQRPLFIVGMPRSGTSLIEQILASHPAVFGAGELTFWDGVFDRRWEMKAADRVGAEEISALAADYLEHLTRLSPNAARVVDKMPSNFMNLGLIHAAFPRARIVHVRRHPVDTCLSIYFQYFPNRHHYGTDLGNLAHYYHQYVRLMDHWRRTLPATALLEIDYESLIGDQEAWSRRLVEFAGLPWDPRCLEFYETDRSVITASKWQVRQKIHSSSSGRWKNYQKFAAPLLPLIDLSG